MKPCISGLNEIYSCTGKTGRKKRENIVWFMLPMADGRWDNHKDTTSTYCSPVWSSVDQSSISTGKKVQTDKEKQIKYIFSRVLINTRKWGKEIVSVLRKERPILKKQK